MEPSEKWVLVDAAGEDVCSLPCEQWLSPGSSYRLKLHADRVADVEWITLPDDSGYSTGQTVDVNLRAKRVGWWPWVATGVGTSVYAIALAIASDCNGEPDCTDTAVATGIAGGILMGGTAIAWIIAAIASGGHTVDVKSDFEHTAKRRLPGYVEGGRREGGWMAVTPTGLAGRF